MKQEHGKRIVSRLEYVVAQRRRKYLLSKGIAFWLGTLCCAVLILSLVWKIWMIRTHDTSAGWDNFLIPFLIIFCIMLGGGAWLAGSHSERILKEVAETDPALLFIVTEDSLSDSLVRASSEPLQAQETVLLRAASEGAENHEEQLLRASTGGQE